ncbi:MAG: dihydrolipoamide succinyltransferase [Gammaproteobacteria bacterium]|nr:MAG: dihydrolipoamide succinyltransferase [Gammaproteobacteria bacterium]
MNIEIKTPVLPESISEAVILKWHKNVGDEVIMDENLLDLETDKIVLEVPAPESGVLLQIKHQEGDKVGSEQILGIFKKQKISKKDVLTDVTAETKQKSAFDYPQNEQTIPFEKKTYTPIQNTSAKLSPLIRKLIKEHDLDVTKITAMGRDNSITRSDVEHYIKNKNEMSGDPQKTPQDEAPRQIIAEDSSSNQDYRMQQRVPMSPLRAKIAQNLLQVTQNTAMLTTFNEVNMEHIMGLRSRYQEKFQKTFAVKLGFMSFFVKASCEALKNFPEINAVLDGKDIVYNNFYDISIAISTEFGLVAPVIKNTELLNLAEIEKQVANFSTKARNRKLSLNDITGGTFTISNGGIFGSMLSTPLLNPPQSAVLGMHAIVKRPIVENDQVVIKPMMNLALSYDHRLIDGKSAITFLKTIKEILEDPARMILSI